MADESAELIRTRLPCDRTAPGRIRKAIERAPGLEPVRDDALLIASELVTNAVLHSGCVGDHVIDVQVTAAPDRLVISVHDPGLRAPAAQPRTDEPGIGGWGLQIVEQLAQRWGAERPDGYRVWAELALAR